MTAAQRIKIRKARRGSMEWSAFGPYYIADEGQPVIHGLVLVVAANLRTMDAAKRARRKLIEQVKKGLTPRSAFASRREAAQ